MFCLCAGDVGSRFSPKRFFSAEPRLDPFYQLQFDGIVESISRWEKLRLLDRVRLLKRR